jgi:hypothetical protein
MELPDGRKILTVHECPADGSFRPAEQCASCPIADGDAPAANARGACSDCATMVKLKALEARLGLEPTEDLGDAPAQDDRRVDRM